ncbi:MAG: TraM recognition domain-containing protein [Planctomycetaceae bacterium]|nr:TraM recognition domain-containing protein [Planctomycetaceae bacterium]
MTQWNWDQPLLRLSDYDVLTIGELMQGTLIVGATGCGKSTGSLRNLALSFLAAGFGGLVLCVKKDEADTWRRYARVTGRDNQLLVVTPEGRWKCNLLKYECERPGAGAGQTENLNRLLCSLSELGERGHGGSQNEGFWENAKQQLLRNSLDVCKAARGTVSISDLHEVIRSAPQSPADLDSEAFRERSFCFQSILAAEQQSLPASQRKDFEHAASYFLGELPFLADRTRSSIVASVTGVTDVFQRGVLRELFATETTFLPEMCLQGGIIVLDLSVKEHGTVGRLGQCLVKLIWQRAMERRDVAENPRPVFLIADEFQEFCVSEDRVFQSTARSSRVCTVYATQNLPSLYAAMGGGEVGKQQADALLGNLQTKILHANGDTLTNDWAANLIGKSWQYRTSIGSGSPAAADARTLFHPLQSRSVNASVNEQFDFDVPPQQWTTLKMGGPPEFVSEAIAFQAGRRWGLTGKNYLKVLFPQGVH